MPSKCSWGQEPQFKGSFRSPQEWGSPLWYLLLRSLGKSSELFSNGRNPHFYFVGRGGGDGLSSPLETPWGLLTLPDLSIQTSPQAAFRTKPGPLLIPIFSHSFRTKLLWRDYNESFLKLDFRQVGIGDNQFGLVWMETYFSSSRKACGVL